MQIHVVDVVSEDLHVGFLKKGKHRKGKIADLFTLNEILFGCATDHTKRISLGNYYSAFVYFARLSLKYQV